MKIVDISRPVKTCLICIPHFIRIGSMKKGWYDRVLNTLRLRQNGCHFPDDTFKCMFFNENVWISIKISLKFVLKIFHHWLMVWVNFSGSDQFNFPKSQFDFFNHHYNYVTWASWHLRSLAPNCLFNSLLKLATKNTKTLHYWYVLSEFTGDCWVPFTK